MPDLGPLQFDLEVSDTFQTRAPNEPLVGTVIRVKAQVSVNWNLARTEIGAADGVTFSALRWLDAGRGPLPVHEIGFNGTKKTGTISYEAVTGFFRVIQEDTAGNRYRWLVTPYIKLVRTFSPLEGAPTIAEAQHAQGTAEGAWQPLP